MENLTNITYDIYKNALYNPSCLAEMEKFSSFCTEFKVNVTQELGSRFRIIIVLLVLLIFYKMYVEAYKPNYSQTEFYKTKVAYRIDFVIMIVALISIAYFFI